LPALETLHVVLAQRRHPVLPIGRRCVSLTLPTPQQIAQRHHA